MITLQQKTLNTQVVLTLGEKTTISNPYYLFEFENTFTKVKYYQVLVPAITNNRYQSFNIDFRNEEIGPAGWFWYRVYQQDNGTNLDPELSAGLVEQGKMLLNEGEQKEIENFIFISDNENNANYVFIDYTQEGVLDEWGNTSAEFGEIAETWGGN
jgi:hypothetical protein